MEQEPQLSYEVPVSMPGILVDRLGYLPEENKTAIFKGKDLPQEFYVVDQKTKQIVSGHLLHRSTDPWEILFFFHIGYGV